MSDANDEELSGEDKELMKLTEVHRGIESINRVQLKTVLARDKAMKSLEKLGARFEELREFKERPSMNGKVASE